MAAASPHGRPQSLLDADIEGVLHRVRDPKHYRLRMERVQEVIHGPWNDRAGHSQKDTLSLLQPLRAQPARNLDSFPPILRKFIVCNEANINLRPLNPKQGECRRNIVRSGVNANLEKCACRTVSEVNNRLPGIM